MDGHLHENQCWLTGSLQSQVQPGCAPCQVFPVLCRYLCCVTLMLRPCRVWRPAGRSCVFHEQVFPTEGSDWNAGDMPGNVRPPAQQWVVSVQEGSGLVWTAREQHPQALCDSESESSPGLASLGHVLQETRTAGQGPWRTLRSH